MRISPEKTRGKLYRFKGGLPISLKISVPSFFFAPLKNSKER